MLDRALHGQADRVDRDRLLEPELEARVAGEKLLPRSCGSRRSPTSRCPPGCTQTISSSSAQVVIIASRSRASNAW
jgi:hypothetical protein